MTSHYMDYRVEVPDGDRGEASHLLARLWQRLHGVLAAGDIQQVGVSLPAMRAQYPGAVLRLHSDAATLQQVADNTGLRQLLEGGGWVAGGIYPVPAHCAYRCFRRERKAEKQTDAWAMRSEERWLKRKAERGESLDPAELLQRRKRLKVREENNRGAAAVYVKLRSRSTHQGFSLQIEATTADSAQLGRFSHYGLAVSEDEGKTPGKATVPWFE